MVSKVNIGDKFEHLTVIGVGEGKAKNKKYWYCLCDCGRYCNIETSKLGKTKSCGCLKQTTTKLRENLTGKVFSHLKVINYAYTKKGRAYWNCVCCCGKETVKQGKLLKMGSITSCGCQKGKNKIKDLTGKKFGELLVIDLDKGEKGYTYWNCVCSCGNKVKIKSTSLMSGNTKTCGCSRHKPAINRKDLTGLRFGRLVVIEPKETKGKKLYWLCKCDCGNTISVYSSYLIQKEVQSCGCASAVSFEEKEVASFVKSIYNGKVIENDREVIQPKELDIYIPEKHFAIEYNGLY